MGNPRDRLAPRNGLKDLAQAGAEGLSLEALGGPRSRQRKETAVRLLFKAAAVTSVLISALIVLSLVGKAASFLQNVDPKELFSSTGWFPRRGAFDIRTIIIGTLIVAGIAMLVAAPLGLGAAIYLSEYARPRVRKWVKPIVEILAGIPSVVLGFFAITFIGPQIIQKIDPTASFFTMGAAGLAVGLLVTPLVASVAEDAIRSVPHSLREASYGMGARKATTTIKVVIPAAVSGIVAALLVGISRAIGETMIVAIAAGASGGSALTLSPLRPGQTMTGAMTALAVGSDQVRGAELTFPSLFFVGLLLFIITLLLNIAGARFVRKIRSNA